MLHVFARTIRRQIAGLIARRRPEAGAGYLSAYASNTDRRVAQDPRSAIGGMWEEIGQLQFDFLIGQGLRPKHTLLDIGCGTLRGGQHFIRYLDAERYTGTDISAAALEAGRSLIESQGLAEKRPRLIHTRDLEFREFDGRNFDFVLAQSVLTHLPREHVEACIRNIGKVLGKGGVFYFTFVESALPARIAKEGFSYPFSYFVDLAAKHGYAVRDVSSAYPHPRGQQMVALTRI